MISITLDIDWAVDEILDHCLKLLSRFDVRVTFFATHSTPLIKNLVEIGHEVGIHPNFIPHFQGAGRPYQEVIDEMKTIFPDAQGVRFHSLAMSAPALDYCFKKGICYDSSVYLPFQVTPYKDYGGIIRIPYRRADYHTIIDQDHFIHDPSSYKKQLPYVYIFHPIHIFLNTHSIGHYEEAKKHYRNYKKLTEYQNTTASGVEDMLLSLLRSHDSQDFYLLKDIHGKFV